MNEHKSSVTSELTQRVYPEQVKYLYANAAAGLATTYINSAILGYVLWKGVAHTGLILWLALLWGFTGLRYLLLHRHRLALPKPDYDPRVWGRRFIIGMLIGGLLWGSVVLFAYPDALAAQIFIAFVIGGMAAGASSSLAFLYAVPLVFNLTSMTPVVVRLLYGGDEIQVAMGLMTTVFLVMMMVFAKRSHDMFVTSARLRFEKSALQDVYTRTRDDLVDATTGRELAEDALRDTENRLRIIIDNAPFVIFAIDREGRYVLSEGKGLEGMHLRPGELVGASVFDHHREDPQMLAAVVKALNGDDATYLREVGGRLYDVICTPLRGGAEQVIGCIGIETDVTEKMKVESLRRDLISTVSHELRTPLTSIVGALHLLEGGVLDSNPGKSRELLESALRNSNRLVRLVNDILDVEKLGSGKVQFHLQVLGIDYLLHQAIDANRGYADKFGVRLELEQPLYHAQVQVDEDRFLQVLANLLSNAIKHSPKGAAVTLGCEPTSARSAATRPPTLELPRVTVTVIDRGPGIPEDQRELVFEKFTQVNAERSLVQGGTGLGLNIARSIVRQLGGELRLVVDAARGETRFAVDLPEWRRDAAQ